MLTKRFLTGLTAGTTVALQLAITPAQSLACGGPTPAFGVDDTFWGSLRPTDVGQLPPARDSTDYHGQTRPDWRYPLFSGIDLEGTWAFTSYSTGFKIWDIAPPTAQRDPQEVSGKDGWQNTFLVWDPGNLEIRERIFDIDVPDGNGNVAAVVGISPVGTAIWNTTTKSSPSQLYQDTGITARDVYTATIGGRSYAFTAAHDSLGNGIQLYDLTTAAALPNPCSENHTTSLTCFAGIDPVYKGRIGPNQWAIHLQGFAHSNGKHYLAASAQLAVRGVELWDVSNPQAPVNLRSGGGRFLATDSVYGVAMWQQGASSYLAMQRLVGAQIRAEIYNITSCLGGGCTSLPNPIWSRSGLAGTGTYRFTTFSRGGSTPYLYFGVEDMCSGGLQREYLYDVTNAGDPQERGVEAGVIGWPNPDGAPDPFPTDYWSWYYDNNPTGFSFVMPRRGRFKDGFFYRAAWTVFDVHQLGPTSPSIQVTGPDTGYAGDPVPFSATAVNCTPAPGGWSWSASGGGVVAGTGPAVDITWATAGGKTVTATNTGCPGAQGTAGITILDPTPVIGSVSAAPTSAPVCTPITFTAIDVTGQPPLTYSWTVEQGGNPLPGAPHGSTNPFVWNTTSVVPGVYTADVTVTGVGSDTATSPSVTLTSLPPLPLPGGWTPTNDPFPAGTVQFHANLPGGTGATEWRWDFDDGTILQTTDPAMGTNPVHTYTSTGTRNVVLGVRNCQAPGFVDSNPLVVDILQIDPLEINVFQAQCPFNPCAFEVGQAIGFTHDVDGDPDFYDYDWNGDGSFEDDDHTAPVTTHTYNQAGTYLPVLRVRRGAEQTTFTHLQPIIVSPGGPPPPPASINISGPTSGLVNTEYTFNATAQNCSPSSTGWTWTTSGGTVTGSSSGPSIEVRWSTTGSKVLTARNSNCGAAQDSHTIVISEEGGGGGQVDANFTFSPPNPSAGQEVTFDGSGSTGDIFSYVWEFGDGQVGSGETVTHTYNSPGSYNASLTVIGCVSFGCPTNTETRTVGVTTQVVGCIPDGTTLCLLDDRFRVKVRYQDQHNGGSGVGTVLPFPATDQTGAFWFFNPSNPELLFKMVDGRTLPGNAFWVFYGALTDVEFFLDVTDTRGTPSPADDVLKQYHNLPGTICGVGDTTAFPQGGELLRTAGAPFHGQPLVSNFEATPAAAVSGSCVPSAANLCLLDGRFSVEVSFHDQHNDQSGEGTAVAGTNQSGYFWFFNPANFELVVKMIDATVPFGHFWVFWGALTDVEYTIRVTDTVTTEQWTTTNEPGNICGGADTTAF